MSNSITNYVSSVQEAEERIVDGIRYYYETMLEDCEVDGSEPNLEYNMLEVSIEDSIEGLREVQNLKDLQNSMYWMEAYKNVMEKYGTTFNLPIK